MKKINKTKLIGGALILAGALLMNSAPAMAQDYGYASGYNNPPTGQLDSLVSRIALYPDPLLAQIFAASAFPDQVAAAAQGSGGPFDPSVEALMQYPSVLQMMASDPGWTQALGQAVTQDEAGVMDAIQNLRQQAQQYGYLQSGPQMQVVDQGGYIDILPVGGYMYVPMYDPYVVFARPRPGFFVGGAIRFGGGFRWAGGYNRFDWGSHEVFVNRRVWTPPVRRSYEQPGRGFAQQRNFQPQRQMEQRSFAPQQSQQRNFQPQRQMEQRSFAPQQSQQRNFQPQRQMEQRSFAPSQQPQQRNFAPQRQMQQRSFAPSQQPQQRNFAPQRQMEQRNVSPQQRSQPRNEGGSRRGGEDRGHGR